MKTRIGVYICHCGANIFDYVDIAKVKEVVGKIEGVETAIDTMFACSDYGQNAMLGDIEERKLDGMVVAACSPTLHYPTFCSVAVRGGLNKYNYAHANIREQSSWAHSDDKEGATEKAIQLIKAAIAKVRKSIALQPIIVKTKKAIAVIGAGVAGMRAAKELADLGTQVYLIERADKVGGKTADLDSLFNSKESGKDLARRLENMIKNHENIALYTQAELIEKKGSIGNFDITIKITNKEKLVEVKVGSILVATGFESYKPKDTEFSSHLENVINLPDFVELIKNSNGKLVFNNKEIKDIAYVYCVGSRQVEGENKYCSRYCCTAALNTAVSIQKKYKDINNYHFNRGIRTYGKQEVIYDEASRNGDVFIQYGDDTAPEITQIKDKISIKNKDILSMGQEIEVDVDLVVLVTGMVAREDDKITSVLKIPRGRDRFFNEIHMKLRPVETVIDGVTICGACQGPKNIAESMDSALAAATKSQSIVKKGEIELDPIIAQVDEKTCEWCDKCMEACPFDAISSQNKDGKDIAVINSSVCKGCGMCLPVCESDSLDLDGYTNDAIEDMIEALANYNY